MSSSPRLNISAMEFRPGSNRSASSSLNTSPMLRNRPPAGSSPMAVPAPPWQPPPQTALSAYSTSSAGSSGGQGSSFGDALQKPAGVDDEDEEEDEFSPFATQRASTRVSTSSAASDTGPEDAVYDPTLLAQNPSMHLTPFDVLCSILIDSGDGEGSTRPQWTAQQVEDALSQNNYDVDATLGAVMANNGQPLPLPMTRSFSQQYIDGPSLTPRGEAIPQSSSLNPKLYFTPGNKGHARGGAGGVALLSADAFAASKRPPVVPLSPDLACRRAPFQGKV